MFITDAYVSLLLPIFLKALCICYITFVAFGKPYNFDKLIPSTIIDFFIIMRDEKSASLRPLHLAPQRITQDNEN